MTTTTATPARPALRWAARGLGVALALVVGLTRPAAARAADHIEEKLPFQAYKVLKYLKEHGYHNVGVLNFRVQKGHEAESFKVGPLNANMANRMESALNLKNGDEEQPLTVLHDAGKTVADRKEHVTYLTSDGCERLFKLKYQPVVAGKPAVSADAFVTGVVRISPDKRETTVHLEVIGHDTKRRTEASKFTVKTDRNILSDVAESFVINPRRLRTMGPDDADDAADKSSDDRDKDASADGPGTQPRDSVVELEVLYDGNKQDVTPHQVKTGEYQVTEPRDGQTVTFTLKNTSSQRVAVVLAMNGKNTLYQEPLDQNAVASCHKWVLDPGVLYTIDGYFEQDNKSYHPFRVLSDDESRKEEELDNHPKLGAIEMFVFQEGAGDGGDKVTTQGLRKSVVSRTHRPKNAKEAAKLVRHNQNSHVGTAGVMRPSGDTKETNLQTTEFKNPTQQEARVIWYYERKAGAGGSSGNKTGDNGN
jgi:hypothetical protein